MSLFTKKLKSQSETVEIDVASGVLYDCRILLKLKGIFYTVAIRQAMQLLHGEMLVGNEITWRHEHSIKRVLRWMSDNMLRDGITNQCICMLLRLRLK